MIKSFLTADDRTLTVNDSNISVYGNSGIQTLKIKTGAMNIIADSEIEKFYFDNALNFYKFQQAGNELKIFDNANNFLAQIGVREDGTFLTFSNGTIKAEFTAVGLSVGNIALNNQTAISLTNIPASAINVSETSTSTLDAAFTVTSNTSGVPTQEGKTIVFNIKPNAIIDKTTQLNIDLVGQALNSITSITDANDFIAGNSIVFNPGDTADKQITVTVKNDGNPEGIEAYKARLLDATGTEKGSLVGTIVDGLPIVNLSTNASSVNEGNSVVFNVTSDIVAPVGGIAIPYKLSGTSLNSVDYTVTPSTGVITIPAGEKTAALTFNALTDSLIESPETIIVTLDSISNATINTNTATATIIDTSVVVEANKFFFSGSASVSEGGKAIYTISHTAITGSAITIPYTITGTATNGVDYTVTNATPITFNVGDTTKTIEFPIIADSTTEGNETLTITLGTPSLNTETIASGQSSITTTILDSSLNSANNSFKLTTAVETITGTDGNDLISAYIDASGTTDTFNNTDVINAGSGNDTLLITVDGADAGTFPTATITGIETVSIKETGGIAGSYDFALISGETSVINNKSSDDVSFTNITSGTKIIVEGDNVSVNGNTTFKTLSGSDAVDLTFNNGVTNGNVTRNNTGSASITINSTGAENSLDTLDLDTASALTSLNIIASTNLTASLATDYATGAIITISGAAAKVDLSGSALSSAIRKVDASSFSGGVMVKVNQIDKIVDTQFIGGNGNDIFDIGKVKYNSTILTANGALGLDTLKISDQDALSTATISNISNFERLEIYDDNDGSVDAFDVSLLKGISTIQIDTDSTGDGYVLNNLSTSQALNVVIAGNQTVAPSFNINNATFIGNIDTLGLTIDAGATGKAVTVAGITAIGVEQVNLNAIDGFTATTLTGLTALATLTILGSGDVNLTTDKLPLNLNSTIDATLATGMITVNASAAITNGISIKGSLSQANVLTGTEQADVLTGGAGADFLTGGTGADTLNGGGNADILNGGSGNDVINGGAGADIITGAAGSDTLSGGSGDDSFIFATTTELFDKNALVDSLIGGSGTNSLLLGTTGTAFAVDIKDIWTGASGIDTLIGVTNSTANTIILDKSAETAGVKLVDLSSNTALTGNKIDAGSFTATNTTLIGSATGATSIVGGAGADAIYGGAGSDSIMAGAGADTIYGGMGSDLINLSVIAAGTSVATADAAADQIYLPSPTNSVSITGFGTLDQLFLTQSAFGNLSAFVTTVGSETYFETPLLLTALAQDFGANGSAGIVAVGDPTGIAGVKLYFTTDMGAVTTTNSQLFLTLTGLNTGDVAITQFTLI